MFGVVVVWHGGTGHFQVITSQEEQERITSQTYDVGNEYKRNCSFGFQLESLQYTATYENADTSSRYGNGSSENTSLAFANAELRLQIFWKENHKTRNYHKFHAGSQAGYDINRICHQSKH